MDDPQHTRHLVLQAQAGNRRAQDELLRKAQVPLYNYLCGLCGDRHLAEDVLQEVFVLCLHNLRWLRDPDLFRSWLYRIASREAFRALRRGRREVLVEPEDAFRDQPATSSIPLLEPDERALLRERVERLSPASRAVLLLHYLHELPLEDVAEVLGLALGTVKSRLAYGLATLRDIYYPRNES